MGRIFSPHYINSILVESQGAFRVSAGNITRYIFSLKKLLSISLPDLTMNIQECDALIQVSSVAKSEEINKISRHTVANIEVQVTRTDDTMVVLRAKSGQKSSMNIVIRAASYESVREKYVIPIQEVKK